MNLDLRKEMRAYGFQKDIAKTLGISVSMVSAMQTGKKRPSDALLSLLGWERVTTITYRKKKEAKE